MRAAHMDSHISGKTFEVNDGFSLFVLCLKININRNFRSIYQCTLCDKKLQSRTSYRNHMKRHTEEKKHECEHCGKRFFTRYHLKLHQSKIHKGLMADTSSGADLAALIDDDTPMIVYE